ncbi:MAG: hypothetical protein RLZZ628_3825 [Bacteroidota bacterium]|jgi:hypothetical protein
MKTHLLLVLFLLSDKVAAQRMAAIATNPSFQDFFKTIQPVNSNIIEFDTLPTVSTTKKKIHYWRLNVDNDFLIPAQRTDRYYTNGIFLEHFFVKNGFKNAFGKAIFPKIDATADNYYGVNLQTEMYTPDSIWLHQPNDRPYCGVATFGMTCISKQPKTGTTLTTEYRIGILGPAAMQGELQRKFHQLVHRPIPIGWNAQIGNSIAFNLHLKYEQHLNYFSDAMEVIGISDVNLGTLSTNAGVGFRVHAGAFQPTKQVGIAFLEGEMPKKLQSYVYFQPFVHFVMTNTTLQGGISLKDIERKSYIQIDHLTRIVGEMVFAYHLNYGAWGFEYRFQQRTREWDTGKSVFFGSCSLQKSF